MHRSLKLLLHLLQALYFLLYSFTNSPHDKIFPFHFIFASFKTNNSNSPFLNCLPHLLSLQISFIPPLHPVTCFKLGYQGETFFILPFYLFLSLFFSFFFSFSFSFSPSLFLSLSLFSLSFSVSFSVGENLD